MRVEIIDESAVSLSTDRSQKDSNSVWLTPIFPAPKECLERRRCLTRVC